MPFFPCRHRWSLAGKAGATILVAWAVSGCGGSSLKTSRPEAGRDVPGGGGGAGDPDPGDVEAAGGTTSIPGTAWDTGAGGQGGSTTASGGSSGQDGAVDAAGGDGGAVGGRTGTGGSVWTGGRTGTGGATSTGGRPRTGGTSGAAGAGGMIGLDGGLDGPNGLAATVLQPLAKAFCAAARICCQRDGFYKTVLDDCEAKLSARLQTSVLVDQGVVTVDSTRLAACVSAYEQTATTCTTTRIEAACQGVWLGTRAEGQPCGGTIPFGAFDCMAANGAAACYWADAQQYPADAGVCVALPRGQAGDECSKSCQTGQDCIVDLVGGSAPLPVMCFEEDGVYCAVSANPPVCMPIAKVGAPCTHDSGSCSRDSYCNSTSGTCQVAAKLGESCADYVSCAAGLGCATGIRCAEPPLASSKVCQGTPSVP